MRSMILGAVLSMFVYTSSAPRAQACSPAFCRAPVRLFTAVSSDDIRGNLVYFKVLTDDPGPLTLRAVGGDVIPSSIRMVGKDRVFAPDEPIAPGTEVQLDYTLECGNGPMQQSYAFKTYAHEEVSLRDAELAIEARGIAYPGDRTNEAGFVELRYYDPEDGTAYYLIDRSATIDGKPATIDQEGRIKVSSYCDPKKDEYLQDTCGTTRNVPLGEHTVEVRASIVGLASDPPPVRLKVRTDCSGSGDASAKNGAPAGCSIGLGENKHVPAWFFVLALALRSWRRRRA